MSLHLHFFKHSADGDACNGFRISESELSAEPYLVGLDLKGRAKDLDADVILSLAKGMMSGLEDLDNSSQIILPGQMNNRRRRIRILKPHRN